jgi:adhesin/invasin
VVAWFTGGGPVDPAGPLVTGGPAPNGLSPITGNYSVTVGTVPAQVLYIGLSPGWAGLYQVDFVIPQIAKGTYPLQITIAGQASNEPVIAVGN